MHTAFTRRVAWKLSESTRVFTISRVLEELNELVGYTRLVGSTWTVDFDFDQCEVGVVFGELDIYHLELLVR